MGMRVVGLDDVDGDGLGDFAASNPYYSNGWYWNSQGQVYVYSGASGALLWSMIGTHSSAALGSGMDSAGDYDGDGIEDLFAVQTGRTFTTNGDIFILSGTDGRILDQFACPPGPASWDLAVLVDDLDGDGARDLAVPTRLKKVSNTGGVAAVSWRTGQLLWETVGSAPDEKFGQALVLGPDLDGDGLRDLAAATPYTRNPVNNWPVGQVALLSAADGSFIDQILGAVPDAQFGLDVAIREHPLEPGVVDLLVGEPRFDGVVLDGGRATRLRFSPFLRASDHQISQSAPQMVEYSVDFPDSEALRPYALLASASGTGPTLLGGLEIPLSADPLLSRTVLGPSFPSFSGQKGSLDSAGDAVAQLLPPPGSLLPLVGRRVYLCAVSSGTWTSRTRLTSVAIPLDILP